MTTSFKNSYSLEERKLESDRIRSKYPDRIPVICEKIAKSYVQVNCAMLMIIDFSLFFI